MLNRTSSPLWCTGSWDRVFFCGKKRRHFQRGLPSSPNPFLWMSLISPSGATDGSFGISISPLFRKRISGTGMVVHSYNPCTWEMAGGGSGVQGLTEPCETLSQNTSREFPSSESGAGAKVY